MQAHAVFSRYGGRTSGDGLYVGVCAAHAACAAVPIPYLMLSGSQMTTQGDDPYQTCETRTYVTGGNTDVADDDDDTSHALRVGVGRTRGLGMVPRRLGRASPVVA
jgi:hypothetical protein